MNDESNPEPATNHRGSFSSFILHRSSFAAIVISLGFVTPAHADVRDVAALFPAETLTYAEVSRPAESVDALAVLLKQSPLADSLLFTHDRLDKATNAQKVPGILASSRFALLGAPELFAESKRIRGAGGGIVGFDHHGDPRFCAAILLGDSHSAALLAKLFLTTTPDLRRVAVVDGVPVFQYRVFVGPLMDPNGVPFGPNDDENPLKGHKLKPGTREPTFAFMPGLFVIGSDLDAVTDALTRFAGTRNGGSLATLDGFATASGRGKPGLFLFARPAEMLARLASATKDGGRADSDAIAWSRFVLNPKSVRQITGNLHLGPGSVTLSLDADREPNVPSPLFDVLGLAPIPQHETTEIVWSGSMSLPATARRASAVLALADAFAKANGVVGRLPSDTVKERRDVVPLADLLGTISGIAGIQPKNQELPKGVPAWPAVVLTFDDEAAATKGESAIPAVMQLLTGTAAALPLSAEVVDAVRVQSVLVEGVPGNAPIHFTRSGRTVVFALDRKAVATIAKRPTPAIATDATAPAFGIVHLAALVDFLSPPGPTRKPIPVPVPASETRPNELPPLSGVQQPARESPSSGLRRIVSHLPPVAVTVTRPTAERMRWEAGFRGEAVKPIGSAIREWLLWLETRPVLGQEQPPSLQDVQIGETIAPGR